MASGDGSFEAFYAEHFESVFRGLAVAFRDPLLAEEAAQEAFFPDPQVSVYTSLIGTHIGVVPEDALRHVKR